MSFQGARFPSDEPPIDKSTGLFNWRLLRWFNGLRISVDAASTIVPQGVVQLTAQTATIGTTAIPTGDLAAGLYRVEYYAQVLTAAGVSSSFQVTISWTRNGVAQSEVGTLKNANTTATHEADKGLLVHIDGGTPISYAIAYASNPAAAMVYEFSLALTLVSRDN